MYMTHVYICIPMITYFVAFYLYTSYRCLGKNVSLTSGAWRVPPSMVSGDVMFKSIWSYNSYLGFSTHTTAATQDNCSHSSACTNLASSLHKEELLNYYKCAPLVRESMPFDSWVLDSVRSDVHLSKIYTNSVCGLFSVGVLFHALQRKSISL